MLLILQHQRSDGETDHYHLKPGRCFRIGRGSTCEIRILDLNLSRNHGNLEFLDGSWRFTETGSTNGCRINGDVMDGSMTMKAGMILQMGSTTLVISQIFVPGSEPESQPGESSATRAAIDGHRVTATLTAIYPPPGITPIPEPTFYVTLLGVRIGPLSKAQAKELKSRELRHELDPMDLNGLPRPAPSVAP